MTTIQATIRGMGVPPMRSSGIPLGGPKGLPVSSPFPAVSSLAEQQQRQRHGQDAHATPQTDRLYMYCIVDLDDAASLGQIGAGENSEVLAVGHEGIAALVSGTSADKLEITRGNALAHQRVMEAAMQRGRTVLPVRFNTIAEGKTGKSARQRIIDHVLVGRRDEIRRLLTSMHLLVELGVKGLWTNMEGVFQDIVARSPEIQSCRRKLLGAAGRAGQGRGQAGVTAQMTLGEMVKKALEARKLEIQTALLERLSPVMVDLRANKTFGDPMFTNLAILVNQSRQDEVAAVLSAFEAQQGGLARFRYVGPLPPCNFLELVITWDD